MSYGIKKKTPAEMKRQLMHLKTPASPRMKTAGMNKLQA
jgi:hypothetical protein